MCCRKGKVALPPIRMHPVISAILSGPSAIRRHFIDKSRTYNKLFAWTSQGAKFDTSFTDGFHQVRINGEVCHKMGPLLPRPGDEPNFAQIHILDDEAQVERRMGIMTGLRRDVVQRVQSMISADNPFARAYRYASNPDNTTADHLIGRAVLTPCNAQVDDLNNKALEKFPGELRTYNSADDVPELADGAYPPG